MPELCRFGQGKGSAVVAMYFNDHQFPHIHVKAHDQRALVAIGKKKLRVMEGALPNHTLRQVMQWAAEHVGELLDNWHNMQTTGRFTKIAATVSRGFHR